MDVGLYSTPVHLWPCFLINSVYMYLVTILWGLNKTDNPCTTVSWIPGIWKALVNMAMVVVTRKWDDDDDDVQQWSSMWFCLLGDICQFLETVHVKTSYNVQNNLQTIFQSQMTIELHFRNPDVERNAMTWIKRCQRNMGVLDEIRLS